MADTNENMKTLAETENYVAWQATDPDGETAIHLELGALTVHFFPEEWDEFLSLIDEVLARKAKGRK